MNQRGCESIVRGFRMALLTVIAVVIGQLSIDGAQTIRGTSQVSASQASQPTDAQSETDLQSGISLTGRGAFAEAIPHFLGAKGRVADEFALEFNLALCYIGTGEFETAIPILRALREGSHEGAGVENLLAQAYAGNGHEVEAFDALKKAAALNPKNEKLYLFVADAFLKHQDDGQNLRVIELGLEKIPESARLHYEHGYLLSTRDDLDGAKQEYHRAAKLAGGSEIGFLAEAQEEMLTGNLAEAVRVSRAAIADGEDDYQLLTILGEALIRLGATPEQKEFAEARASLEKSVAARPNYASSQIALGHVDLLAGQLDDAILHLEAARRLSPRNTAAYPLLAAAYRKIGRLDQAEATLTMLANLNQEEAQRIRTAPGDSKAIPGAPASSSISKKPPLEK